nr:hypothetical protein [Alphaproteobacteria bacterium]
MNFLLNTASHGDTNAALLSIGVSFFLGIVIAIAYYVSKKFTDSEFRKLKNIENAFFDRVIIVAFSALISVVIMVITILLTKLMLASFINTELLFTDTYCRLIVALPVILTICYALIAPGHDSVRPFDFSSKDAHVLFQKLSRIVIISLAMIIIGQAVSLLLPEQSAHIFEHSFGVLSCIYYFIEMYLARSLIEKCLYIPASEAKSQSVKLVIFINRKFSLILLMGMLSVIAVNYLAFNSEVTFLANMKELFCILVAMLVTQMIISAVLNAVLKKFETMAKEERPYRAISARQKNFIWICDVLILFTYLFLICVALQYFGINVKEHI